MLQSKLFYKTFKENPKEAEALSHAFLIRGGFIDRAAAGVYTFLPLGFLVLKKIENIIREEMNAIGGQEILMPVLASKENWEKTGRWTSFEELFKLKGQNEKEYALNPTHEEMISPLAKKFVFSHKDLPFHLFQIQTKFRNELRVKSGLLRTREFLMKDLYSFHSSQEDLDKYYSKVEKAYFKIFKRCGVKVLKAFASGGSFSKYSHEFQAPTEAGEDLIYVCRKCSVAVNKEIKQDKCQECGGAEFEEKKAVEVGNIFKLGDKYSLPFELKFKDEDGKEKLVVMGCYGIGLGRLMASVVELNNDKNGIIWPKEVSPFDVHLIRIGRAKKVRDKAEKLYEDLQKKGFSVLYDDRDEISAGQKFAESDLIGISTRLVVSEKTLKQNSAELKERAKNKICLVKFSHIYQAI